MSTTTTTTTTAAIELANRIFEEGIFVRAARRAQSYASQGIALPQEKPEKRAPPAPKNTVRIPCPSLDETEEQRGERWRNYAKAKFAQEEKMRTQMRVELVRETIKKRRPAPKSAFRLFARNQNKRALISHIRSMGFTGVVSLRSAWGEHKLAVSALSGLSSAEMVGVLKSRLGRGFVVSNMARSLSNSFRSHPLVRRVVGDRVAKWVPVRARRESASEARRRVLWEQDEAFWNSL